MSSQEPIAIVGSACRLPGGVDSPSRLWEELVQPRDLQKDVSHTRFPLERFGEGRTSKMPRTAYLLDEDPAAFDAPFFAISPAEAEGMDPQQRLLLEVTYEALEAAGYGLQQVRGTAMGVFVGMSSGDFRDIQNRNGDDLGRWHATSTATALLSNRLSYFFDLHGPSLTVDTACSSSLVGLHLAVQALRNGDCDMAVVAGANLLLDPLPFVSSAQLELLSTTGQCRMWDAAGDGYGRGEGVVVMVLKSLAKAVADGDDVESVVRETGVNHNGRTPGVTMPSAAAQQRLMRQVYSRAGIDAHTRRPRFFEAHGTGTRAGDPIEARAIHDFFFAGHELDPTLPDSAKLAVGSLKTVMGHLEGAAGIAGLLKASLVLQHRATPPNLLFNAPNAAVTPFLHHLHVPVHAEPWPSTADDTVQTPMPALASVNSFGFGGANAHCLLEEAPAASALASAPLRPPLALAPIVLSANTARSLVGSAAALGAHIRADPNLRLDHVAWTLAARRSKLAVRTFFAATDRDDLLTQIDNAVDSARSHGIDMGLRLDHGVRRVLGVFTGQGAQWAQMGRHLHDRCPLFRQSIAACQTALDALPDSPQWSIANEMLKEGAESRIAQAAISQPLCTALQIALVDLITCAGVRLDAVVGHSSGEIAACYYMGLLSARDAICIAYYRGIHSHLARGSHGASGAMMAVAMSHKAANEFCSQPAFKGKIQVAASNSPSSVTLSGDEDVILQAQRELIDRAVFARLLKVDTAYHSLHMLPCAEAYLASLQDLNIQIGEPRADCIWTSSVHPHSLNTTRILTHDEVESLTAQYWVDNMTKPVLFAAAIDKTLRLCDAPFELALEIGPHPALAMPVKDTIAERAGAGAVVYTGLLERGKDDVKAVSTAMGMLWQHSADNSLHLGAYLQAFQAPGAASFKVVKGLPTYAWDHKVYWRESRISRVYRLREHAVHPLLGSIIPSDSRLEFRWHKFLSWDNLPFSTVPQFQGQNMYPLAAQVSMIVDACFMACPAQPIQFIEICNLTSSRGIVVDDTRSTEMLSTLRLSTSATGAQDGDAVIHAEYSCHACSAAELGQPELVCAGKIAIFLNSAEGADLPCRSATLPHTTPISSEDIYDSFTRDGFDYSGMFRRLSNASRANGFATASASWSTHDLQPFTLHPAVLDAGFQLLIPAAFSLETDAVSGPHLPTRIGRISFGCGLARAVKSSDQLGITIDASSTEMASAGVQGDIAFYDSSGTCILQIESLALLPLSKPDASDDRSIFNKEVWKEDIVGLGIAPPEMEPDEQNFDLARAVDRSCLYFFRQALQDVKLDDIPDSHPQCRLLLHDMSRLVESVRLGSHSSLSTQDLEDSYSHVHNLLLQLPDSSVLQGVHVLGQHLPAIMRGQVDAAQLLRAQGIAPNEPNGDVPYKAMEFWANRIAFKFPGLDVLQVGAGSGTATAYIFEAVRGACRSYTYTDVSVPMLETLTEPYPPHLVNRSLDITRDIQEQGFKNHRYDLVISSTPIQTPYDLKSILANLRYLLRPGGYLLLAIPGASSATVLMSGTLVGPWQMNKEISAVSLGTSLFEWDTLLRDSGFSGVEQIVQDSPLGATNTYSVIATHATSDIFDMICDPLPLMRNIIQRQSRIVLVGGLSLSVAKLVRALKKMLTPTCSLILTVDRIEKVADLHLGTGFDCLCFSDLDRPVLAGERTPSVLESLKIIFKNSRNMLWYTSGRLQNTPDAAMSVGIGRALRAEMPQLNAQFIDLTNTDQISPSSVIECYCKLILALQLKQSADGIMWVPEPELVIDEGVTWISRVVSNDQANDRFNANTRPIYRSGDAKKTHVSVSVDANGQEYLSEELPITIRHHEDDSLSVNVQYSISLDLVDSTGTTLCLASFSNEDAREHQVFVISDRARATMVIRKHLMLEAVDLELDRVGVLSHMARYLQAAYLAERSAQSSCTLLYGVDKDLAHAIQRSPYWQDKAVVVVMISSEEVEQSNGCISLHPRATRHSIQQKLTRRIDLALNCSKSTHDQLWLNILETLQCRHENLAEMDKQACYSDLSRHGLLIESYTAACQLIKEYPILSRQPTMPIQSIGTDTQVSFGSIVLAWKELDTISYRVASLEPRALFTDSKSYFLAGMTRSLGLSIASWMIRSGARHLVLASRNPQVPSQWLNEMSGLGANIKVMSLDLSDKAALTNAILDIRTQMPPIAGVCNASAASSDSLLADATFDSFDQALKAKVDGSRQLDQIFSRSDLDFFVLFGCIASEIGIPGHANDHAANLYMSSLIMNRRKRGLAASIMDIGLFIDVALAQNDGDSSVLKKLRKQHVDRVSEPMLHHLFAEAILVSPFDSGADPKIIVGPKRVSRTLHPDERPVWFSNPRFSHFLVDEELQISDKQSMNSLLELLYLANSNEDMIHLVTEAFQSKLESLMAMEPGTIAQTGSVSLLELGFDSGLALQVRSWFDKELNISMPFMKILTAPNFKTLSLEAVRQVEEHRAKTLSEALAVEQYPRPSSSTSSSSFSESEDVDSDNLTRGLSSVSSMTPVGAQTPVFNRAKQLLKASSLSPSQSQLWTGSQLACSDTEYNMVFQFDIAGVIDSHKLKSALTELISQQESLRSSFASLDNGEYQQFVWGGKDVSTCFKHIPDADSNLVDVEYARLASHSWRLEEGETFQLLFISNADNKNVLILGAHHMAMDGLSVALFIQGLSLAYKGKNLTPLAITYTDFARDHLDALSTGRLDREVESWVTVLTPVPETMPLFPIAIAGSRKPMGGPDTTPITVTTRIGGDVANDIRATSRKLRCTPFHFFTAALNVLCSKMTAVEDVCIGITDSGRHHQQYSDLIGHFATTVPLRSRVAVKESFSRLIPQVLSNIAFATENAMVPFQAIVGKLPIVRQTTHLPIFQVAINFMIGDFEPVFGDSKTTWSRVATAKAPTDLSFWIFSGNDGSYRLQLDGRPDVYSSDGLELLLTSFASLLRTLCSETETPLEKLNLYSSQALQAAIEAGRGPTRDHGWEKTLVHRFDKMAERYPDEIAVVDEAGPTSYRKVQERVHLIASTLQDRRLPTSSAIAVICGPSMNSLASMLAILRLRHVYVPLDLSLPAVRHLAMVEDCKARIVLYQDSTADRAMALQTGSLELINHGELSLTGSARIPVPNVSEANDPAILLYTSGSTSVPKGVILPQTGYLNYLADKADYLQLDKEVVLQQSSMSFDMGLAEMLHGFCHGGRLVMVPQHARGDPVAIAQLMFANKVTFTIATPTEYISWLSVGLDTIDEYTDWRHACFGGEFYSERLVSMFRQLQRQHVALNNSYGPTETSCATTLCKIPPKGDSMSVGFVGKPISNSQIYITDLACKLLPLGHPGEICIGGAGLAIGYLNAAETQERFVVPELPFLSDCHKDSECRVYKTGDRGKLLHDGSLILMGRMHGDTQMKLHGLRIDAHEVEHAIIKAIPNLVAEAVVTLRGTGDDAFLVAHVVLNAGKTATESELQLITRIVPLPRYMIPKTILAVAALPKTQNGKIDRRALANLPLTKQSTKSTTAGRLAQAELGRVWRQVLDPDGVMAPFESESDFFLVGGNSLLLIKLQAGIKASMGVSVPVADLYAASTLGEMTEKVAELDRRAPPTEAVDWDEETRVHSETLKLVKATEFVPRVHTTPGMGKEVLLTGANEFLGSEILSSFLTDDSIAKVHCVAVPEAYQNRLPSHSKIVVYTGSLGHPTLALSEEDRLFFEQGIDAIVHAGSEGHCLNKFSTLRAANLLSTKFLAQMAVPRLIPIHYVSGTRVTLVSGSTALPPQSVAAFRPAHDSRDGFTASKWASEAFLESLVQAAKGLAVTVHRPCGLIGENASPENVTNGLVKSSAIIRAVPRNDAAQGYLDFKDVQEVARDIVCHVKQSLGEANSEAEALVPPTAGIHFIHHSSGFKVPARDLGTRMEMIHGGSFRKLDMADWLKEAVDVAGLHHIAVVFLEAMMDHHVTSVYPYMGEPIAQS